MINKKMSDIINYLFRSKNGSKKMKRKNHLQPTPKL